VFNEVVMRKIIFILVLFNISVAYALDDYVFESGHGSLSKWTLPEEVPFPENNRPTQARVDLGKALFFDPRLSGDGNMSCASCHNPMLGWSDGLKTAKGHKSQILGRATPTIINTAYNSIQMWDGRKASLEDQATGPLEAEVEMHMDIESLISWLNNNEIYRKKFNLAYPGEGVSATTLSKAIASYERTIISRNSPFDNWVEGNKSALTESEIAGFKLFVDPEKGNCEVCHSAPNFTDNGFHNVGLELVLDGDSDFGRYKIISLSSLKGAFKTPTLRDISYSAPYFHDGSSHTLEQVVKHYVDGWKGAENLSLNIKEISLTESEIVDLTAFLNALSSPKEALVLPELP